MGRGASLVAEREAVLDILAVSPTPMRSGDVLAHWPADGPPIDGKKLSNLLTRMRKDETIEPTGAGYRLAQRTTHVPSPGAVLARYRTGEPVARPGKVANLDAKCRLLASAERVLQPDLARLAAEIKHDLQRMAGQG